MKRSSVHISLTGLLVTSATLAHYTWVAPAEPLEPGKPATIRIGHGHKFPESEEAINARQVDLFALTPSGKKINLTTSVSPSAVTAQFTPPEPGAYRIGFVQDRGVSSRTPQGVRPGGRDKNPNATQAYRTLRTAMSYCSAGKAAPGGQPAGLEIEIAATQSAGVWRLQVLKQGKPVQGVAIEVFLAGAPGPVEIGKTAADGRIAYTPAPGAKGPAVFSAAWKDSAPPGAPYDFVNYETSLFVSL